MENTQLSSKNNLFTGNIYQNNDTQINILDESTKIKYYKWYCTNYFVQPIYERYS